LRRRRKSIAFQVLVAAVAVRQPLASLARIVEVEHRGHGVHAQSVDVVAVEPEQGARDEVIRHFAPAEIEDGRAPIRMEALARILVLVEGGAVEARETVRIDREVGRHPVDDHAQARRVAAVDEARERRRFAEAARRREQADRLIAPRVVERMLVDGHQLEMREPHVGRVRDERVRRARRS
jgi:hypothetical protein